MSTATELAQTLALSLRPVDRTSGPEGNDGLTDLEREYYASRYRLKVARPASEQERADIRAWLERKRAS